jgi:transposase
VSVILIGFGENNPNSRKGEISPHLQGRELAMENVYVGIDISKEKLDICILPSKEFFTMTNDDSGIIELAKKLAEYTPKLITFEATGGLEISVASGLYYAGLNIAVVNPRQVRDFARAFNKLAKTDKIDSYVLALFAEKATPRKTEILSDEDKELKELVIRRNQLMNLKIMESNRQRKTLPQKITQSIGAVLLFIGEEIKNIDIEIKDRIKKSSVWHEKDNLIKSIPGVGDKTSQTILACVPELGKLTRRQIASLAGLAPMNRDSGKFRGKRTTIGGRSLVRSSLYMPTLCALKFNPIIKKFYDRLISKGKSPKIAITACMRKLLTILNAVMRDNRAWNIIPS